MKNCESLANAIRERLADEGSRVLFAGRLSGSELELGRAVGEYFRTAPAAARADSPELFSLVEKAERAGISGEVHGAAVAVHWGFGRMLWLPGHPSLTFQHWAGVSTYTSAFALAGTCVCGKQSLGPLLCDRL